MGAIGVDLGPAILLPDCEAALSAKAATRRSRRIVLTIGILATLQTWNQESLWTLESDSENGDQAWARITRMQKIQKAEAEVRRQRLRNS